MFEKIQKIENLANGSKLSRLMHNPMRYINAMVYSKFIYPNHKKGRIELCETFFGTKMNVVLPAGMDIYLLGAKSHSSEIRLAKFICNTLNEGDTFLDIGAHFGYFSLLASKIVGKSGNVFSIEASKAIHAILSENTAAHANIHIFHAACTDEQKMLHFYEFPILYSEYNTLAPEQYKSATWLQDNKPQKIQVQGRTADDIIDAMTHMPDFIKIDVEGAESQVISGMRSSLSKATNMLLAMEFLQDNRMNTSHMQAAMLLSELNYSAYYISDEGTLLSINVEEIPNYLQQHDLESDNIVFKQNY